LFLPVSNKEIEKAENILGVKFPSELERFYKEIGYGFLTYPYSYKKDYIFSGTNRINPPSLIVEMIKDGGAGVMSEDAFELLSPGDLPVFEIGDSSSFMIMKPLSNNPNAVWYMGYEKIEDSFERFIYNLYYDDPSYYSRGWADEYLKTRSDLNKT
jgi:hypothetical protein